MKQPSDDFIERWNADMSEIRHGEHKVFYDHLEGLMNYVKKLSAQEIQEIIGGYPGNYEELRSLDKLEFAFVKPYVERIHHSFQEFEIHMKFLKESFLDG